jgi:integrase
MTTGHVLGGQTYTVRDAVESWLAHGLTGRQESTVVNRTILARTHVIPALGARKLAQLSAEEVDEWLATKAKTLSTDTLHRLLSILRQSIRRAQARDQVKRIVALLCDVPRGTAGRPSKSLTLAQAAGLLAPAQKHSTMHAYVVVSLLTGARTEELRALTWSHTDLDGEPPSVQLWRSVREGGDTKTRLSRRTLELPNECVVALRAHRRLQTQSRMRNAARWPDNDLVFTTQLGTPLDAANVRRASARWPRTLGSELRTGHRESCGTVLSRCCRAQGSRSRTSRISSATRTPVRRKRCIARNCGRC